jgi:hypothetical protein
MSDITNKAQALADRYAKDISELEDAIRRERDPLDRCVLRKRLDLVHARRQYSAYLDELEKASTLTQTEAGRILFHEDFALLDELEVLKHLQSQRKG